MKFPDIDRDELTIGVAAVVGVVVLGGVVWGFGRQITLIRQLRAEEKRLERVLKAERARHEELTAKLKRVKSDTYVEQWAREEAKMAKPGEVVIIMTSDTDGGAGSLPHTQTEEPDRPEPQSFWAVWWRQIHGSLTKAIALVTERFD